MLKSFARYAKEEPRSKHSDAYPELVVNDPALVEFIRQEVGRIAGPTKENAKYLNIVCPFHDDHDPSLGIRIADPTRYAPLGSITCISGGCRVKGPWSMLADRLGLQKLPKTVTLEHLKVDRKTVTRLMGKRVWTMDELVLAIGGVQVYRDWPAWQEWRGFDGKFLQELGGQELTYQGKRGFVYRQLLLPVRIDGELIGGVRCRLKSKKGQPSYLNTAGEWSSERGLFPYDHVAGLGKKYVILVEGPRDAMRLVRAGVPALCILGAGMFNRKKALLVAALDPDCVFLLGDGDKAGRKFNESAYEHLHELVATKAINLPMNGMDPFGMPDEMMRKVGLVVRKVLKEVRS